jgi:hypothetical protein
MGHGANDKLYITHAEHSGALGQHSASSGHKVFVSISQTLATSHSIVHIGKHKHLILVLTSHLIAARYPCSHSLTLYALGTKMALEPCSTY